MKILLTLLILNHSVLICFELYIESIMVSTDSQMSGRATGYGMLYALIVFPSQFLFEILLIVRLAYQMFFVKHIKAHPILWIAAVGSFFIMFM